MPSTGRVASVIEPTGPGVRVDSALYEGAEISLYYDSLLAKLIVWGETRADAILRMRRALDEYKIAGVRSTLPLHQQIMETTQFIAGNYDTRYLEDQFRLHHIEGRGYDQVAAIVATLLAHQRRGEAINHLAPAGGPSAWKQLGRRQGMRTQ